MGGYTLDFGKALLQEIGAPITQANLDFLNAWGLAEGGNSRNNPFNTGESAPGATPFNKDVNNYPDMETGLAATYRNLQNPAYSGIIAALRRGTSSIAAAKALQASPWGTGSGAYRVLVGDGSALPAPPSGAPLTDSSVNSGTLTDGSVSTGTSTATTGSGGDLLSRLTWIFLPSSWVRIQAGIIGAILIIVSIILFAREGINK